MLICFNLLDYSKNVILMNFDLMWNVESNKVFINVHRRTLPPHNPEVSEMKIFYNQCWGKLLLKVMHYNIALLPKKVTNYIT